MFFFCDRKDSEMFLWLGQLEAGTSYSVVLSHFKKFFFPSCTTFTKGQKFTFMPECNYAKKINLSPPKASPAALPLPASINLDSTGFIVPENKIKCKKGSYSAALDVKNGELCFHQRL